MSYVTALSEPQVWLCTLLAVVLGKYRGSVLIYDFWTPLPPGPFPPPLLSTLYKA